MQLANRAQPFIIIFMSGCWVQREWDMKSKLSVLCLVAACGVIATAAGAQDKVKIGLITTLSGSPAPE
jgi:hypothetical protein